MGLPLNKLRDRAHDMAKEKGWWDDPRPFVECAALVMCEMAEAIEAKREGRIAEHKIGEYQQRSFNGEEFELVFRDTIKDTVEDELADTIIRILDMCGYYGINIAYHVELKMKYNATRPYKHGKQF